MKATYTKILARNILLAFLAFTIIFSVAAFFVRKSITKKLENISNAANSIKGDQNKPGHTLLLLHQAEDDFQESLLNNDRQKRIDYKVKLSQAFAEIDTLLKQRTDTSHLTIAQNNKVKYWYQEKLKLSGQLYSLKHNFDSLLTVYADFNTETDKVIPEFDTNIHHVSRFAKSKTDTITKSTAVNKKGLFGRIKDAIANKNDSPSKDVIINHNNKTNVYDIAAQKMVVHDKRNYVNKLRQLQQRNIKLLGMQRQLIALNTNISNELEYIVNSVKEINYNMAGEFREISFKNYQETATILNKFYLVALLLVLTFAILLIIFIIQLNRSELYLRKEIERSVTIAQQKMDLLLHMSHEIRNPLTAIMGFLYIFSKTKLEKKQVEMLDSIRTSSDMLLQTLNDTLDAAKLENSEFKLNIEPFNPDFILRTVIESIESNASSKNLTLDYAFKGDKEVMLLGDNFRLRQIMVNLLSNAIKYTDKGSVSIVAEFSATENRLNVDVVDTGVGISLEQQSSLFSKYYQTSSSKGQMGTGLGLFICRQLIDLQGGKISLRSKPGSGSTFSFFIPYQKSSSNIISKSEPVDEQSALLNNISVLGVDDNELNLMPVKMMLNKWNAKFYKAGNGTEALEVIAKNKITVVLTDIQMPGMDGNELLAAIRKLDAPLNKLPVIVISGNADKTEAKTYLKKGFSGVIGKPFTSAELLEQLTKVLRN